MTEAQNLETLDQPLMFKIFNGILLIISLILGGITFFAILDLLITLVAPLVIGSTDSTVQEAYIFVSIRNFWMFFGGCFFLGFLVVGLDYHTRRLGNAKTRRILLVTLVIEILIISTSVIL